MYIRVQVYEHTTCGSIIEKTQPTQKFLSIFTNRITVFLKHSNVCAVCIVPHYKTSVVGSPISAFLLLNKSAELL